MMQTTPKVKWNVVGVLSLAHMLNDMCTNFLPQLIPMLVLSRGFSVSAGTTLVAAFTMSSSLVQPLFGYLVDQKGKRWLVFVGTLWMTLLLGISGFIENYAVLLVVSTLAGLGTAAFHPQAAGMVGQVSGNKKGFVLAAFIAMGNVGLAVSPLVLLPLFHRYGTQYTWVIMIPGVIAALLLYKFAPREQSSNVTPPGLSHVWSTLKKSSSELSILMLVVAIRSFVHTGLMSLLPIYLLSKRFSPEHTGDLVFATLLAGAVGGLIGGYVSDRFGRKPLVVISLALASTCFYGFLYTSGAISYVFLALGGMALLSSFSVTVAAAQELIPENKALASGLSLGFAIGMGGLAVSPLGKYADINGINSALSLVFILPMVAAVIGLLLKIDQKRKAAYTSTRKAQC